MLRLWGMQAVITWLVTWFKNEGPGLRQCVRGRKRRLSLQPEPQQTNPSAVFACTVQPGLEQTNASLSALFSPPQAWSGKMKILRSKKLFWTTKRSTLHVWKLHSMNVNIVLMSPEFKAKLLILYLGIITIKFWFWTLTEGRLERYIILYHIAWISYRGSVYIYIGSAIYKWEK